MSSAQNQSVQIQPSSRSLSTEFAGFDSDDGSGIRRCKEDAAENHGACIAEYKRGLSTSVQA